jgi:hypothetical protein
MDGGPNVKKEPCQLDEAHQNSNQPKQMKHIHNCHHSPSSLAQDHNCDMVMPMKVALFPLIISLLSSACSQQSEPNINENSSGNPVSAPVDYLGAVNKGRKKAIIDTGLMQVNSALNQFKATKLKPASSLQELVSEGLLAELPQLPAGTKWQYNPQTGEASVAPL